jgi:hypothetical protein
MPDPRLRDPVGLVWAPGTDGDVVTGEAVPVLPQTLGKDRAADYLNR